MSELAEWHVSSQAGLDWYFPEIRERLLAELDSLEPPWSFGDKLLRHERYVSAHRMYHLTETAMSELQDRGYEILGPYPDDYLLSCEYFDVGLREERLLEAAGLLQPLKDACHPRFLARKELIAVQVDAEIHWLKSHITKARKRLAPIATATAEARLTAVVRTYDSLIDQDPSNAEAFYGRANAYENLGEHDAALRDYEEAISLNPFRPDDSLSGYVSRGRLYEKLNNLERAISDYTAAILSDPADGSAYSAKADVYSAMGDHERAVEDLSQSIRLTNLEIVESKTRRIADTPDDFHAYLNRADAYEQIGECRLAVEDYGAVIRLAADDTWVLWSAYSGRGCGYAKLGEFENATRDYDKLVNLDAKLSYAQQGGVKVIMNDSTEIWRSLTPEDMSDC